MGYTAVPIRAPNGVRKMESSKNVDIPPVIKHEFEKRLARVFVQLRQHERKVKLAKKAAELNTLRGAGKREKSFRREEAVVDRADAGQDALVQELFEEEKPTSQPQIEVENVKNAASVQELEREVEELRKGINFKDFELTGTITASDLGSAMRSMNRITSKADIQWMIWEVDDDLDGCIDWDEFRGAYARGIVDKQGTEPNQLFCLIQFLLSDPDGGGSVSFADVKTELQRIYGTNHLVSTVKKALSATNEQLELEKHSLQKFLDAMLTQLPASFNVGNQFPPK